VLPRSLKLLFEPWDYDDKGRKRLGSWSQSYSGSQYWILDPIPEEVNLVDIVVGLSNAARYRGQTRFLYSVLQHSVMVSRAVEKTAGQRGWDNYSIQQAALQGLLHDGSEAYLGDVARPLKRAKAMREYCRVERLWENVINERFDIKCTEESNKLVDEIDKRIVLDEIQVIMRDPDMWARNGRYLDMDPLGVEIQQQTQEQTMAQFYARYQELRPMKVAA
jgi:uncharacterized protein